MRKEKKNYVMDHPRNEWCRSLVLTRVLPTEKNCLGSCFWCSAEEGSERRTIMSVVHDETWQKARVVSKCPDHPTYLPSK